MLNFNLKGSFIFFDMLMLAKKTLTVFVLFLPSVALCLTINEELRSASQLMSVGNIISIEKVENASRLVSIGEPRAYLAHWLRAQSLYGIAGIGFEYSKKDLPFIEEAKVRSIPLPQKLLPENILAFPNSRLQFDYFLIMETNTSRLFVYKLNEFDELVY